MGQKVHPEGFRLGVKRKGEKVDHRSSWYSDRDFANLLGEDLESIARSPHLDYFRANDVEVLYLVDPVDPFMIMGLTEYEDKPLKNIDDASLELPPAKGAAEEAAEGETPGEEAIPDEPFGKLVGRLMTTLGSRVTQVRESQVLHDNPCRLVSPEDAPGREMQYVYRLMNQEYEIPARILEVNRRHLLMHNLARMVTETPRDPIIETTIEQLYENQLLIEGLHPNPAAMISRIQRLMEAATATAAEQRPAPQPPAPQPPEEQESEEQEPEDQAPEDQAPEEQARES